MKLVLSKSFLATAMAMGLAVPAMAVNSHFATGDLVITFQKIGSPYTVYADLGSAATLRDRTTNHINFVDLNAKLNEAFSPSEDGGWKTDPEIYAGLAGVYSSSFSSTAVVSGDPARTLYVSSARNAIGIVGEANSPQKSVGSNTDMTNAAIDILAQNKVFSDVGFLPPYGYDAQVVVSPVSASKIDDMNPISVVNGNPLQGTAFRAFGGGNQQAGDAGTFGTFGAAGTVEFALDLYRILGANGLAGQVEGPLRAGSYEGTITVGANGMVSFTAQSSVAYSPFETWALTFPALDTEAKRLPSADPDNDGLSNLMEFVLDGNPGSSDSPSIAPTLNASGTDFVFGFNRRDDSETGNNLLFQYGSDLTGWTDVTIGATGGTVGSAIIAVTENTTNPDAITVTVPKTVAPAGKLFGRLKVTQP